MKPTTFKGGPFLRAQPLARYVDTTVDAAAADAMGPQREAARSLERIGHVSICDTFVPPNRWADFLAGLEVIPYLPECEELNRQQPDEICGCEGRRPSIEWGRLATKRAIGSHANERLD